MNINIVTFNHEEDLFKKASELRFKIVVEEFNKDKFAEFDSFDMEAIHYLLFFNNIPVGVARSIKSDSKFIIDRFGILNKFRSNGFGSLLIRFIVKDLLHAKNEIYIEIDNAFAGFFEKNNFKNFGSIDKFKTQLVYSKIK
jgi:hypothetical protein